MNVLGPPLDDGYHDGDDGCVVEKSGDDRDWDHEAKLRARDGRGVPEELGHVPVEAAGGADPGGDDEEHRDREQPFVRESVQSFLDGDDARGHEHGDRADHDVVGLDDVPQEASEGYDDHADGEPSLPNLSLFGHRDGHTDAPAGTLLYSTALSRWFHGGGAPGAERVSVSAVRIDERDRRAPTVRLILDTRALLERSRSKVRRARTLVPTTRDPDDATGRRAHSRGISRDGRSNTQAHFFSYKLEGNSNYERFPHVNSYISRL